MKRLIASLLLLCGCEPLRSPPEPIFVCKSEVAESVSNHELACLEVQSWLGECMKCCEPQAKQIFCEEKK